MRFLKTAALLVFACSIACADTVFTSQSAFLTAAATTPGVSTPITQNFTGIAAYGDGVSVSGGITLGNVNYAPDSGSPMYIVDAAYYPTFYSVLGSTASLSVQGGNVNAINATLVSGTSNAIGFSYNTFSGYAPNYVGVNPLLLTLNNGESFTLNIPTSGSAFFGVITHKDFSKINLSLPTQGGAIDMGEFIYSPVPEPGSLLLMGTGLVGIAGAFRRKISK